MVMGCLVVMAMVMGCLVVMAMVMGCLVVMACLVAMVVMGCLVVMWSGVGSRLVVGSRHWVVLEVARGACLACGLVGVRLCLADFCLQADTLAGISWSVMVRRHVMSGSRLVVGSRHWVVLEVARGAC